jgi:glutamate synthase domain-containing protein 1
MCGIVGLYSKSPAVGDRLGVHLARMLVQMGDRGPDSAGVAVYRDPVAAGSSKLSLYAPEGQPVDWGATEAALERAFGAAQARVVGPRHACVTVGGEAGSAQGWIAAELPGLRVMSAGSSIEIVKEAVAPAEFARRFALDELRGSHALGHTRMATESRVTTEGSHPFSTGEDLCLVHNGSLSNHNRLRRKLRREGIVFQTENDSEVAAGYLTWRLREGATLEQALEGCLEDLDGFYTFAVGTADGFAVLRDPIACKPAVMAETADWVAMASEYRALALLPGAAEATVWEPEPGRVYSWSPERLAQGARFPDERSPGAISRASEVLR